MTVNDDVPLADGWDDETIFKFVSAQADYYGKIKGNPDDVRWVAGFAAGIYFMATIIPRDVFDTYAMDAYQEFLDRQ